MTTLAEPAITPSEQPPLPPGWVWTTLGEISAIKGGITKDTKKQYEKAVEVPYLRVANVQRGFFNLSEVKTICVPSDKLHDLLLQSGDILFNEGGDRDKLGRGWVWKSEVDPCTFQNHVFRARPRLQELEPKFFSWYGNTLGRTYFDKMGKQTTNLASINITILAALPVPLPPLAEQQRIVTRIEELFSKLDAGVSELKRTQALLKRYRQSLLHAAVTGELSREWREANPAPETGTELLHRILKERRAQWAQSGKKGKYKEPQGPEAAGLPELPHGWTWASVEQIALLVTDGDHNPPKRVASGIPHLTAKNIRNWHVNFDGCTYIAESDFERVKLRYSPQPSDLLITCVGTIGRTAIVPRGIEFSPDRNLAAIRVGPYDMNVDFLQIALNAPVTQELMRGASGSTAQPHLYLSEIRALPISLPPIPEQTYIVSEVERRLSILDNMEATVAAELKRAEATRQSILHRAFTGELVPQDPADEPASVLLERIQAEKVKAGAKAMRAGTGKRGRPRKTDSSPKLL
ncbi:type I restriction enzyme S subunit [Deinococcus sp. HSC-46F16]|uniref:restriction endonuclease subunit S n=1 Tax=Deinococcus sp. HSC-46F16 TaxID=2910968 RepID=UPI0020A22E46|nr:restriction endonuclease subunit S [Deinococcus sp. HSC-46F16]MCP2013215.1 type I restriction enzyme S subunit [Deinococcus sp. HSC-46F16]